MTERRPDEISPDRATYLTTMHYVLQMQRASTVAESTGRASMFLTSVSMALVALGFIAQATKLDAAFYAFAFALLAALLLIGLSTFHRAVQLGTEDAMLATAAERLRAAYVDADPGIAQWLTLPVTRDGHAELGTILPAARWQILLTVGSMIAFVNACLAGVSVGLIATRLAEMPLVPASALGLGGFALGLAAQMLVSRAIWVAADPSRQGRT